MFLLASVAVSCEAVRAVPLNIPEVRVSVVVSKVRAVSHSRVPEPVHTHT